MCECVYGVFACEAKWVRCTFDVSVNNAVLMEDIDGYGDLLGIQPDDVLLKAQP